ncbi:MAG: chloramphenicol acetyltransferase [Candidatus Izemoplasmatales bacterium]|nr:chloramphenicol acetyltransferase [Candidatus Izemoplasmatales bacterium]
MKDIDIFNWNRRVYYEFYKSYANPCFSLDVNIDITSLISLIKTKQLKFFPSFLYCLMRGLNSIDEFKYRIKKDRVVIHDIIHPSFTVLNSKGNYVFCYTEYKSDFKEFYHDVLDNIEVALKGNNLEDEEGKDDLVFISSIPWISFTSVTHPFSKNDPHSIPRVTFGKYFESNNKYYLPISFQVHHGLCDGLHIARLIEGINETVEKIV